MGRRDPGDPWWLPSSSAAAPPFPLPSVAPTSPPHTYVCVFNSPVSLVCQHAAPRGQASSRGRCPLPRRPPSPPLSVPLGAPVTTGLVGVFEQPREEIKYTKPSACSHVSRRPAELLALPLQRTFGFAASRGAAAVVCIPALASPVQGTVASLPRARTQREDGINRLLRQNPWGKPARGFPPLMPPANRPQMSHRPGITCGDDTESHFQQRWRNPRFTGPGADTIL